MPRVRACPDGCRSKPPQLRVVEARLKEAEVAGAALLERIQQSEAGKDALQATAADLTAAQERLTAALQVRGERIEERC